MKELINIKDPEYHSEWMMLVSIAVLKFVVAFFGSGYFILFAFFLWDYMAYINPLLHKANYLIIFGCFILIPVIYQIIMGIGLLYKKKWARLISTSFSGLFIALFTIGMFIIITCLFFLLPVHLLTKKVGEISTSFIIIFGFIYLFYIFSFYVGIPVYSVIVLQRDKIKRIFNSYDNKNRWCDNYSMFEISFMIVNVYFAIVNLFALFYGLKFPFFDKIVGGSLAYLCFFMEFIVLSSAVYFIVRKNIIGWSLSFFIHVFNCVLAYTVLSKNAMQKISSIYSNVVNEHYFRYIPMEIHGYIDKSLKICCISIFAVIIVYHLFLRKYYTHKQDM